MNEHSPSDMLITGKRLPRALIATRHELSENPAEEAEKLKLLASLSEIEAVTMPDLLINAGKVRAETARNFARSWHEAAARCDIVIADLSAFRGAEMDSDIVFAIAHITARGGIAAGWSDDKRGYDERVSDISGPLTRDLHNALRDKDGLLVHDHGWPGNRLAIAAILETAGEISSSFEEACNRANLVHAMRTAPDFTKPAAQQPNLPETAPLRKKRHHLLSRLAAHFS